MAFNLISMLAVVLAIVVAGPAMAFQHVSPRVNPHGLRETFRSLKHTGTYGEPHWHIWFVTLRIRSQCCIFFFQGFFARFHARKLAEAGGVTTAITGQPTDVTEAEVLAMESNLCEAAIAAALESDIHDLTSEVITCTATIEQETGDAVISLKFTENHGPETQALEEAEFASIRTAMEAELPSLVAADPVLEEFAEMEIVTFSDAEQLEPATEEPEEDDGPATPTDISGDGDVDPPNRHFRSPGAKSLCGDTPLGVTHSSGLQFLFVWLLYLLLIFNYPLTFPCAWKLEWHARLH